METVSLQTLNQPKLHVLHTLSVKGPTWAPYSALLCYVRIITPNQNPKDTDVIDEQIIEALQLNNATVQVRSRTPLLFVDQKENFLRSIGKVTPRKMQIQFNPDVPQNVLLRLVNTGEKLKANAYYYDFELAVYYPKPTTEDFTFIPEFLLCNVPYQAIDALINTIQPVRLPV